MFATVRRGRATDFLDPCFARGPPRVSHPCGHKPCTARCPRTRAPVGPRRPQCLVRIRAAAQDPRCAQLQFQPGGRHRPGRPHRLRDQLLDRARWRRRVCGRRRGRQYRWAGRRHTADQCAHCRRAAVGRRRPPHSIQAHAASLAASGDPEHRLQDLPEQDRRRHPGRTVRRLLLSRRQALRRDLPGSGLPDAVQRERLRILRTLVSRVGNFLSLPPQRRQAPPRTHRQHGRAPAHGQRCLSAGGVPPPGLESRCRIHQQLRSASPTHQRPLRQPRLRLHPAQSRSEHRTGRTSPDRPGRPGGLPVAPQPGRQPLRATARRNRHQRTPCRRQPHRPAAHAVPAHPRCEGQGQRSTARHGSRRDVPVAQASARSRQRPVPGARQPVPHRERRARKPGHRSGLPPQAAMACRSRLHGPPDHRTPASGAAAAQAAHAGPAGRGGGRARGREPVDRRPGPHQGPVSVGPPGAEEPALHLLAARELSMGRQPTGRRAGAAHRPGGDRRFHRRRPRPAHLHRPGPQPDEPAALGAARPGRAVGVQEPRTRQGRRQQPGRTLQSPGP
ncbi:hypothetical protein D3C87_1154080 [compost metagenome]